MPKYYIYRYIDSTTKKIVYIGKTGRLSVEDRLNQHTNDKIGMWCKTHSYYIEFLELPKEEDMNYIESYLIRKYVPKCNVIFADNSKMPPFDIQIDENLWKSYEKYLAEKKKYAENMIKISQDNIASNISAIIESNTEFDTNLNETINNISGLNKQFIKFLCIHYNMDLKEMKIPFNSLLLFYKISENDCEKIGSIICDLQNIKFKSRLKGTVDTVCDIQLFKEICREKDNLIFKFGDNYRYILEKIILVK